MTDRSTCLSNLSVGDIFHAEYPNGAKCICLVLSVNDSFIHAKRVTSQENLKVDRRSGIESDIGEKPLAVINSVAPLPAEFHDLRPGCAEAVQTKGSAQARDVVRDLEGGFL